MEAKQDWLDEETIQSLIDEFKQEGVVAVPIFSPEEVASMREAFHASMKIDHEAVLNNDPEMIERAGGARMKSAAAHIYYPRWKINAITDPRILYFMRRLMAETYGPANLPGYEHPLGSSDDILPFIDCCHYRMPDSIRPEGGLGLHLDRNPHDPYLRKSGSLSKFRPIQSWIGLTDHYGAKSGGLQVVKGFHREIDSYFAKVPPEEKGGEFYRMPSNVHGRLYGRVEPVDAPAGCLVLFDNRLPHCTAEKLGGRDTREIIFSAYLPNIELNRQYVARQAQQILRNLPPPAFENRRSNGQIDCGLDWRPEDLTSEQRQFLGV
eukprot:TRINITY_DN2942_c0_g1_i2.p1 TRINITY_DN2942_c0_g1~~TRINITY_DN2942_c0_g1_i2.p1  ORF type:complete len:322 (-),score=49.62 TRINITY_DN2942_c0_g1_i2:313-1278(-)